ncbi:MAG: polysaccharide biosynthesis C-terminal domain-containing protein [Vicinamibacteria bacterium]|nr:polysaccharide biosynthesis C-terminal domain-containing protein [Vicinamibacteria bacterium]
MTATAAGEQGVVGRVAWGTFASLGRIGVTFAVWFLLTPFMIHSLGAEGYGLWSLLFSMVGFLSLLDLGTGAGVVRCVAETRGHGRLHERDEALSTYLASSLVLSLIGVLGIGAMDLWALPALGIPTGALPIARTALWLVGLRSFILAVPLGFVRGVLFGENRLVALNVAQAVSTVIGGLLTAGVLALGAGVRGVAWAGLLGMLIEHLFYLRLALPYLRGMRLSWRRVTLRALRRASSLGLAQLMIAASGLVLLRTDPLIVQAFFGMAAVSMYAVAMKVAENTFLIIKQFVNALSPLIAEWHAAGKTTELRELMVRATRLAGIPAALIGGAAIGGGSSLLRLWLGPEFEAAALPMRILVLSMVLTVPQMVVFGLLTYSDRHHLPARASVVAALVNLALSLLLVRPFGLSGVALGTLGATAIVDVVYVLRSGTSAFGLSFPELARRALLPTWTPLVLLSAFLAVWFQAAPPRNLVDFALKTGIGMSLGALLLGRLALEPEERALILGKMQRLAASFPSPSWRTA